MWHIDEPQNGYLNIDCQKEKWEMVATVWQRTTHDNFYIVTNCCLIGDVTSCFYLEGAYVHSMKNYPLFKSRPKGELCISFAPHGKRTIGEKKCI
jgi:hypothetical protein